MNKTCPKIGICIVSQNGRNHLEKLLPGLFMQNYQGLLSVWLADNGSDDDTVSWTRKHFPQVNVLPLSKNYGFAVPNNKLIDKFLDDSEIGAVVCLNNDTIVSENFISTLVKGMDCDSEVGSVQTKVVSCENLKIIDSVGITIGKDTSGLNRGQGEQDVGQYEKTQEIFGATASACLYTRKALEATQLPNGDYFDASYFAYNEDVDLAWRMRLLGFSSWYMSGDKVLHVHSATGVNYSSFKSFHIHRNTLFNIVKNLPRWYLLQGLCVFIIRYFSLIGSIVKKTGPSYRLSKKVGLSGTLGIVIRAWASFFYQLPLLLKKRLLIQSRRRVSLEEISRWFKVFSAEHNKMFYDERA